MNIKCQHSSPSDKFFSSNCSLGKYKGTPAYSQCIVSCGMCTNTQGELLEVMQNMQGPPDAKAEQAHKEQAEQEQAKRKKALKNFTLSNRQLILNAVGSFWDIVKHAEKNNGDIRASDDEIAERLVVCRSCDQYNSEKEQCKKCGCGLSGKLGNKTLYIASKCPLDKWQKITENR